MAIKQISGNHYAILVSSRIFLTLRVCVCNVCILNVSSLQQCMHSYQSTATSTAILYSFQSQSIFVIMVISIFIISLYAAVAVVSGRPMPVFVLRCIMNFCPFFERIALRQRLLSIWKPLFFEWQDNALKHKTITVHLLLFMSLSINRHRLTYIWRGIKVSKLKLFIFLGLFSLFYISARTPARTHTKQTRL